MDSQNYIINIFSLILCIFPNILYTQRITCPTPCDIGYTCAMVRHGTQPSAPGCISMQEAILLHQAMNGGPSGPGSGINNQVGVGIQQQTPGFPQAPRPGDPIPPFPQGAGGTIPGMNFLGSTDPREPGFEQRFAQGLGGQQRNFGFGPPGQVNGQFGRPQVPTGMSGPAFLDPTAGQFAGQAPGQFLGPSGGQFGPNAGQFGPNAGQFGPNAGQFGPNPGQFGGPPPGQFGPSAGQFGPGRPMGFNPQVDACLNRNPWCPVGYVCQRIPTETPGQFEDSCVLQQRQRSSVRPSTMLSGLHNIGSGRRLPRARPSSSNFPGSNSPSEHLDIPTSNRNNPEPQIPLSWIPQLVQDNDIPRSGNVGRRTVTLDDIIREQSLEARDGIRPGLLKKNGVQRQPLARNHVFQRTPVPSNRNQDSRLISTAASPFGVFNSTTTRRNDTTRLPINTKECKPCTNHADCNDIFTYCINKTPCTGKVCFKVT